MIADVFSGLAIVLLAIRVWYYDQTSTRLLAITFFSIVFMGFAGALYTFPQSTIMTSNQVTIDASTGFTLTYINTTSTTTPNVVNLDSYQIFWIWGGVVMFAFVNVIFLVRDWLEMQQQEASKLFKRR